MPAHDHELRLFGYFHLISATNLHTASVRINRHALTASLQFRWLAQPLPHGLFVGEILVFLLFRGKLTKHANHGMRQDAVQRDVTRWCRASRKGCSGYKGPEDLAYFEFNTI